jgi:hypothetical protein
MKSQVTLFQAYRLASKRIIRFAFVFAILFSLCAVAQFWFVKHQTRATIEANLEAAANLIQQEINYTNRWNLASYRRADFEGEYYYIFTSDGFQIETGIFLPGLISHVALIDESIFDGPKTIITPLGETWRLLARHVSGGLVVLGILNLDDNLKDLSSADEALLTSGGKFGFTIAQAIKVKSRELDSRVDYAVISDSGDVESASNYSGIPLRVFSGPVVGLSSKFTHVSAERKSYILHRKPILDDTGKLVGQIVIPKDVTAEQRIVRSQVLFNIALGAFCWMAVLLILIAHFAAIEIEKRTLDISLEDALRQGEGQTIEFKEGIGNESLPPAISAFANTNSGNIFIGVKDNREICGVPVATQEEKERLIQKLRDILQNRIDPLIIPPLKFFEHSGKRVLRVTIPLGDRRPYRGNEVIYRRVLAAVVPAKGDDIRGMSR